MFHTLITVIAIPHRGEPTLWHVRPESIAAAREGSMDGSQTQGLHDLRDHIRPADGLQYTGHQQNHVRAIATKYMAEQITEAVYQRVFDIGFGCACGCFDAATIQYVPEVKIRTGAWNEICRLAGLPRLDVQSTTAERLRVAYEKGWNAAFERVD